MLRQKINPLAKSGKRKLQTNGDIMNEQQINDLADSAANKAVFHIQQHLGQTDGGVAGLHFSGEAWETLLSIFSDYIKAEIAPRAITYDFREGQLVRLCNGRPEESWTIYAAPTKELIACISQNDKNGDFENLPRVSVLEVFLHDYIMNKG
jgi:hypothetical protein